MIELGAMRKPSGTVRQRPADAYLDLRRRAGELMARSKCGGDPLADWAALGEIDRELWTAMRLALDQCRRTGKLHPMIAAHLVDLIDGGLSGKVPPSWPEPTGQQTVWRHDAQPEDIACLYCKAGKTGLLSDRSHTKTILTLYRITKEQLNNWSRDYPVSSLVENGHAVLSTFGLTVHGKAERGDLDRLLRPMLKDAAKAYQERRGWSEGGKSLSP